MGRNIKERKLAVQVLYQKKVQPISEVAWVGLDAGFFFDCSRT